MLRVSALGIRLSSKLFLGYSSAAPKCSQFKYKQTGEVQNVEDKRRDLISMLNSIPILSFISTLSCSISIFQISFHNFDVTPQLRVLVLRRWITDLLNMYLNKILSKYYPIYYYMITIKYKVLDQKYISETILP